MLILQSDADPGPFRSRWQPTWVEVMQRHDSETYPQHSRILRRLAFIDSEEEESDSDEKKAALPEEEEVEEHLPDSYARLPTCLPPGICRFTRSASVNWHRPRTFVPLRSKTSSALYTESREATKPTDSPQTLPDACDLLLTTNQLKNEASLALAQAEPMARMQLEVERQTSPFEPGNSSIMSNISTSGSFHNLHHMDKSQLHNVVDRLLNQISAASKDLVELLIERDNLHMAQDAMLIDVEDQTRRAHELALLMQKNGTSEARNSSKCSQTSDRSSRLLSRVFSWTRPRTNAVRS